MSSMTNFLNFIVYHDQQQRIIPFNKYTSIGNLYEFIISHLGLVENRVQYMISNSIIIGKEGQGFEFDKLINQSGFYNNSYIFVVTIPQYTQNTRAYDRGMQDDFTRWKYRNRNVTQRDLDILLLDSLGHTNFAGRPLPMTPNVSTSTTTTSLSSSASAAASTASATSNSNMASLQQRNIPSLIPSLPQNRQIQIDIEGILRDVTNMFGLSETFEMESEHLTEIEFNQITQTMSYRDYREQQHVENRIYTECPISLESFRDEDQITKLPCGHIFTSSLIRQHLTTTSVFCPSCRGDTRSVENRPLRQVASTVTHPPFYIQTFNVNNYFNDPEPDDEDEDEDEDEDGEEDDEEGDNDEEEEEDDDKEGKENPNV